MSSHRNFDERTVTEPVNKKADKDFKTILEDLYCFMLGMKYHDLAKPLAMSVKAHGTLGPYLFKVFNIYNDPIKTLKTSMTIEFLNYKILDLLVLLNNSKNCSAPAYYFFTGKIADHISSIDYGEKIISSENDSSFQNPFSRIPNYYNFNLSYEEYQAGNFNRINAKYLNDFIRCFQDSKKHQELLNKLVPDNFLNNINRNVKIADRYEEIFEIIRNDKIINEFFYFKDNQESFSVLENYQRFSFERSYPPENDNPLFEHARITQSTAFLLYSALINQDADIYQEFPFEFKTRNKKQEPVFSFSTDIPYKKDGKLKFFGDCGVSGACIDKKEYIKTVNKAPYFILKVEFTELASFFDSSVRLDDFHGIRVIMDGFEDGEGLTGLKRLFIWSLGKAIIKRIFKTDNNEKIIGEWGVSEGIEENGKKTKKIDDIVFPLQESPFSLVFLLPAPDYTDENERNNNTDSSNIDSFSKLVEDVYDVYKESWIKCKEEMAEMVKNDFVLDRENGIVIENLTKQFKSNLPAPLISLWIKSDVIDLKEKIPFKNSTESKPSNNYIKILSGEGEYSKRIRDHINTAIKNEEYSPIDSGICSVCHSFPIFEDLFVKIRNEENEVNKPFTQAFEKILYRSKEEKDELCPLCIAIRAASHGAVAGRSEAVEKILKGLFEIKDGNVKLKSGTNNNFLPPDRFVRHSSALEDYSKDKPTADMDFALVRTNKEKTDIRKIYPRLNYVCDESSNIAIIQLRPVEKIVGQYIYKYPGILEAHSSMTKSSNSKDNEEKMTMAKFPDFELSNLYRDYFVNVMIKPQGEIDPYRKNLKVRPHMARVLTRIRRIEEFYSGLSKVLHSPELFNNIDFDSQMIDNGLESESNIKNLISDIKPIRHLAIENRYPRMLIAIPADRLTDALLLIYLHAMNNLFSFDKKNLIGKPIECLELMKLIVPPLLIGSVVVFSNKQPLYMVMSSCETIYEDLIDKFKIISRKNGDSGSEVVDIKSQDWHGLLWGFRDLRGSLSDISPTQIYGKQEDILKAIDLSGVIDRRSVHTIGEMQERYKTIHPAGNDIIEAWEHIRGKRTGWDKKSKSSVFLGVKNRTEDIIDEERKDIYEILKESRNDKYFNIASFLKAVTRK